MKLLTANRNTPAKVVWRAQIVLATADGETVKGICRLPGKSKPCVWRWQERLAEQGVAGLQRDKTRPPGRKPISNAKKACGLTRTLTEHSPYATHWSVRGMAKAESLGPSSIKRIWDEAGLKPHLVKTFKVSNDPEFEEKVINVVGLNNVRNRLLRIHILAMIRHGGAPLT